MVRRNYLVLLLLALLFAAPGIAAYLFYLHPQWLGAATTNKGHLLNPPELLPVVNAKQKWRLILWNQGDCEAACLAQVDKLARIRLALGRRLYEVEQWLILATEAQQLPDSLKKALTEQDIQVQRLSAEERKNSRSLEGKSQVFIANPSGYLVLAYALTSKPGDIFHDLKHLLSSTENKSD